jgi:hypothetical protein
MTSSMFDCIKVFTHPVPVAERLFAMNHLAVFGSATVATHDKVFQALASYFSDCELPFFMYPVSLRIDQGDESSLPVTLIRNDIGRLPDYFIFATPESIRARDAVETTLAACATRGFAELYGVRLRECWSRNFDYDFGRRPNRLQDLFIFLGDKGKVAKRLWTDYDHIVNSLALIKAGKVETAWEQ